MNAVLEEWIFLFGIPIGILALISGGPLLFCLCLGSHCVAQTGLKLVTLLLPHKLWTVHISTFRWLSSLSCFHTQYKPDLRKITFCFFCLFLST